MPHSVRFHPRSTRFVLKRTPQTHRRLTIKFSPFSTPDQRLSFAVQAIQHYYGQRVLIWRKGQTLHKAGANRPL